MEQDGLISSRPEESFQGKAEGPLVIPEQARAVTHGSGPGSVSISGYPVPATNRVVGSKEAQLPVVGVEGLGPH